MEKMELAKKFNELVKAGRIIYYESTKYYRQWQNVTIEVRHCPGLGLKKIVDTNTPKIAAATAKTTLNLTTDIPKKNPFLPPESELVLDKVGPAHTLLFNKFAVIPLHLLIISRGYVSQDAPLEAVDFRACSITLQWLNQASNPSGKVMDDWLFFYNSGPQSGASQPHRHLQAIPLSSEIPFIKGDDLFVPNILHALIKLPINRTSHHNDNQSSLDYSWFEAYQQCTRQIRQNIAPGFSYSLLFTTRWMLLVPRQAEYYGEISFNALSMIGYLLAKDESELDYLLHRIVPDDLYQTIGYPNQIAS